MSFQVLEINRFLPTGEVLRKIRCLAGRVSVFRSQSESELDKFKKALEGSAQEERFSVLLDGSQFTQQKHIFIGFDEHDEKPSARSIANYLSDVGIAQDNIESLLMNYSLGGLSQASCNQLSAPQWSTLRLMRVLYAPETPWVIVLHEPLNDIPEQFRESLAEQIAQCAWKKQAIIVVTKLSYRPQSWIENEHIARIQLERPRQGTIGFGGGELSTPEAIFALRKEMGITETMPSEVKASAPVVDLLSAQSSVRKNFLSPQVSFYGACALLLLTLAYGSYDLLSSSNHELVAHELPATSYKPVKTVPNNPIIDEKNNSEIPHVANIEATKSNKMIGDLFPEEIRVAWSQAVSDPVAAVHTVLIESPSFSSNLEAGNPKGDKEEWSSDGELELTPELDQLKRELEQDPGL